MSIVDSLWLLAATPLTGVVAQLGACWFALLRFLGSGLESRYSDFFQFISFLCFVIKFVFHFATFSLFQKKTSMRRSAVDHA